MVYTLEENQLYDVIVVGAGAAGLTATSYLSRAGHRVLLCEKEDITGGLINSFQYKEYTFDGGIRAFENSGIILPMLKQLGIQMNLVKNPITIGIGDDFTQFHKKENIDDYGRLLLVHFPENKEEILLIIEEIKKIMDHMDLIYGIDNPLFLDYKENKEYIFKTLLPWLIKYQYKMKQVDKRSESVNEFLGKFTKNQSLIDMITQHFFTNTPSFFALSYFSLYLDYYYPIGGTGVLARKLTEYSIDNGADIKTNTEVIRINVIDREVRTKDGKKYTYNQLIWACDGSTLYNCLTYEGKYKKIENKKRKINEHKPAESVLSIYLGVEIDGEVVQNIIGPHSFYTAESKGISESGIDLLNYESIDEWMNKVKEYLKYTTYEISCPSLRDRSLAPIGHTGFIVSTLLSYEVVKRIHKYGYYEEFKEFCIQEIVSILDGTILKGIKEKLIFGLCSTPMTIEKLTGNLDGAITGWGFYGDSMPSESGFKNISKAIHTPIPNIYQAGQWSYSPAGIPVCMITGKVAADLIHKNLIKDSKKNRELKKHA